MSNSVNIYQYLGIPLIYQLYLQVIVVNYIEDIYLNVNYFCCVSILISVYKYFTLV